jgi:hypothetical protein
MSERISATSFTASPRAQNHRWASVRAVTDDPLAPLLLLPGVTDALDQARSAVDAVLGHRLLRRRSAELSAEAGLRCARASAALSGSDFSLDAVRAGSEDPVVQGALRVSSGLGGLVDTVDLAPLQALARLHVLAARDLVDDGEVGRPREDPLVSRRFSALADLITAKRTGSALVLSAVVHGEILALRAFAGPNGVVARAASRLILVARGLDPKAVCAPDVGHWELRAEYEPAAEAYAAGDLAPWLLHHADAVRLGAIESLAVCEALVRTAEAQQ